MIASIAQWLSLHADCAPFVIFGLLLLAGFSFPISEDILVIISGVLASTVIPQKTVPLFIAVIVGSYLSDLIAYWIGRLLGSKLARYSIFRKTLFAERQCNVERFFQKYGVLALFVGRMIPFGVRNSVFMAAGASRMAFGRFLLGDGLSCLVFSSIVFMLAFHAGENYHSLQSLLSSVGCIVGIAIVLIVGAFYAWVRFGTKAASNPKVPT